MQPVLEFRGVSKSFPGVKALDDVTFAIGQGEVVGLIGENGAGKSTLLKVLNGIYQPDHGEVLRQRHAGQDHLAATRLRFGHRHGVPGTVDPADPDGGREHLPGPRGGVHPLRPDLQIADERGGGSGTREGPSRHCHPGHRCPPTFPSPTARWWKSPRPSRSTAASRATSPSCSTSRLRFSNGRRSICCSRSSRDLKQRASIVFISHRLEEVLEISDRVHVMRDGKVVKELPASAATVKDLHQHMVGRQLHHEYYREARQAAPSAKTVVGMQGPRQGWRLSRCQLRASRRRDHRHCRRHRLGARGSRALPRGPRPCRPGNAQGRRQCRPLRRRP